MAHVKIEDGELVVEMDGVFEKMMALRSTIKVPVTHVKAVRARPPELMDETFIARIFGASLIDTHLGYFWKENDGLVFIDVRRLKDNDIVAVDLQQERLKHLYVECENGTTPELLAEQLSSQLKG